MKPSRAMLRLLNHMIVCDGGWQAIDPVIVSSHTLFACEARGWARLERWEGQIATATITPLGIAAARWGTVRVLARARAA